MPEHPKVLMHNDHTQDLEAALVARFPTIIHFSCTSYAELPQALEVFRPDVIYSVRFAGTPGFPRAALFAPGGPRWIANGGAGTDHFGQWDPLQVTVTNAAGVAADMMAEYVIGGFLHFNLDVPGLRRDQKAKVWGARQVRPLKGKTLLIVGLGHTGRAIAALAQAFGMTVLGTRARPQPMDNVDEVQGSEVLLTLLPRADYVAVAAPLTPATKGLIDAKAIQSMKPGAILADVSRGGVVDQRALYDALMSGPLAAAVLDVFEHEPLPVESPLWALENVLISPHCSSVYEGWEMASFSLFLDNLSNWIEGTPLFNVVDPARGY